MATQRQRAKRAGRRRQHAKTTANPRPDPTPGWVNELRALAGASPLLEAKRATVPDLDLAAIRVTLDTADIRVQPLGFPVSDRETIYVVPGDRYPDQPPTVYVGDDERFVGYPHVICARQLCIYLDPGREWNPTYDMAQVIDRVWGWFDNAANDRFDPRTSLFHAVGGANPITHPAPTIVARTEPPVPLGRTAALVVRSDRRADLAWRSPGDRRAEMPAAVFEVPHFLPYGLGRDVGVVAAQVHQAGGVEPATFVGEIQHRATTSRRRQPVHLGLVVNHPSDPELKTLVFGRIPGTAADNLRTPQPAITTRETPIEWIPMSDERPSATTRRDSSRPTSYLSGKSIELWGCGGLGSWIADLCVRAGAAQIVLRDYAMVHGGHLARQNYTEEDVGEQKITALARRLRSLSDSVVVVADDPSRIDLAASGLPDCDLIIDATINETVAHRLDEAATTVNEDGPLLFQVALDRQSATLGLVITAPPAIGAGPATIDRVLGPQVLETGILEAFHTFWTPPAAGAELVPEPGCSTPTYHGSAADLVATAGTIVSIIGQQAAGSAPGIHLVATPLSGCHPSWTFLRYPPDSI